MSVKQIENTERRNSLDDLLITQGRHEKSIEMLEADKLHYQQGLLGLRAIIDGHDEIYRREMKEGRKELMDFITKIEEKVESKIQAVVDKVSNQSKYIFIGVGLLIGAEFFMKLYLK